MTIKAVKVLQREQWVCPNCEEDEIEEEDNIEVDEGQDTHYKVAGTRDTTLKILQLNIDSIMSKVEELKDFIKKNKIDVFVIQETKLVRSDKPIRIPGYTVVRKDRKQPKGK